MNSGSDFLSSRFCVDFNAIPRLQVLQMPLCGLYLNAGVEPDVDKFAPAVWLKVLNNVYHVIAV